MYSVGLLWISPIFYTLILPQGSIVHLLKISIFVRTVYIAFCFVKISEEFEFYHQWLFVCGVYDV